MPDNATWTGVMLGPDRIRLSVSGGQLRVDTSSDGEVWNQIAASAELEPVEVAAVERALGTLAEPPR